MYKYFMYKHSKNILILTLSFGFQSAYSNVQSSFCPEWITVYVHGTTTWFGTKFVQTMCQKMSFGAPGLHHLSELDHTCYLYQDVCVLQHGDNSRFDVNNFYTFAWSGSLSLTERQKAGQKLYFELQDLLKQYQIKYGNMPKVRLLTFSHGGNVALHMVQHLPFFHDFSVHLELVLVAVPVQKITEYLIDHESIAQSYVISSTRDVLQVADVYFFEKKICWPKRFFATNNKNCYQIQVSINNFGLCHTELLRSFTIHIPSVLHFADSSILALQNCEIVKYNISDPGFVFYNGLNLWSVLCGKRQ